MTPNLVLLYVPIVQMQITNLPLDYGAASMANLVQADEVMASFDKLCFEVRVEFYHNDSSPAIMKTRIDTIPTELKETPARVLDLSPRFSTVHRHIMNHRIVLRLEAFHVPVIIFSYLSLVLSSLENRNETSLASLAGKGLVNLEER